MLHPNSHHCTSWNTLTWTSLDHALISSHQAHRVLAAHIDLGTPLSYGLDHGILSIVLSTSENPRPPPQDRYLLVKFAKDRIPLFQERILTALSPEAALLPPLEKGEHLLKALSSIGDDMFVQKGHHSHRNHKVLTLWNDIKVLNRILVHLQRGESPPHKLTRRKAY
jgi:hypothetical protein